MPTQSRGHGAQRRDRLSWCFWLNLFPCTGLYVMPSAAGWRWGGVVSPTGAAEKAVPPQNGVSHTTLLGGTAYASAIGGRRRLVAWLPQPISHTRRLAASPSRPRRPAPPRPLEPPSDHLRLARPHLV